MRSLLFLYSGFLLFSASCAEKAQRGAADAPRPMDARIEAGQRHDLQQTDRTTRGDVFSPDYGTPALELTDRVSRHGVTWTFDQKVQVGRFVNGDYYVVGPVTVTSIDPPAEEGKNGSILNPPLDSGTSPFDRRVQQGRGDGYDQIRSSPPIAMSPGDALISSISVDPDTIPDFLRPSDSNQSPVGSVSTLTCLAQAVPADAFRPSYLDRQQKIYQAGPLRRDLLPKLSKDGIALQSDSGAITVQDFANRYERPWLELCFFHFDAAAQYQVQYGREAGRAAGIALLLLSLDFSESEKEPLLINFVQYGIDLWGIARAGYSGWPAHGGHGSGRKAPIIFAGLMLGDTAMQSPTKTLPSLLFGEDMQTMFDNGWTGAKVVYAGHVGKDGDGEWGAYEHLPPSQWPGDLGESYRRCCTSLAWVGQALFMRLVHAEPLWNHDPFFAYVDRWMTEDDTSFVAQITQANSSWDYSADWARQGQCWDPFVEQMWAMYRKNLPLPTDGHQDPLPETTWK